MRGVGMADSVSTIAEAVNKAISETTWSKVAIADEMGLKSQGLNDKLMRNKNPKIDFVTKLLGIIGFRLVVVPKSSRLPQGAIVVDPHRADDSEAARPPAKAPEPVDPANPAEGPGDMEEHVRRWRDKYYGDGE